MKTAVALGFVPFSAVLAIGVANAAIVKVDLSNEQVGKAPLTFEPIVGTWVIAQDDVDKVIMLDGRPWYNAKQFAYYPVAILRGVDNFSNGTITMKFKTVGGAADRCSGILFNVKPNGDWLAARYNDTEKNVAIWEFHNGIRRNLTFSDRGRPLLLDRNAWHELKLTVDGAAIQVALDGTLAIEYKLGGEPVAGRKRAPNPDLYPANNLVLRPPVAGKVGLWSQADSTSYFKDYVVHSR